MHEHNPAEASMPFADAELPLNERVADLVSRLTLDEEISLLSVTATKWCNSTPGESSRRHDDRFGSLKVFGGHTLRRDNLWKSRSLCRSPTSRVGTLGRTPG